MKDDIIKFPSVVANKKKDPNPSLIILLEEVLAKAKSGEIDHFVGIAYSSQSNEIMDGWFYCEENPQPYIMIGALRSIENDLLNLTIERRT